MAYHLIVIEYNEVERLEETNILFSSGDVIKKVRYNKTKERKELNQVS